MPTCFPSLWHGPRVLGYNSIKTNDSVTRYDLRWVVVGLGRQPTVLRQVWNDGKNKVFVHIPIINYSTAYPVIKLLMETDGLSKSPVPLSEKIIINLFCSGFISLYSKVNELSELPADLNRVDP